MALLTIEIPDKEIDFVTEVIKKIGGQVKTISYGNSPYNPIFVAKVQKGVKVRKSGEKGHNIDVNNLWK